MDSDLTLPKVFCIGFQKTGTTSLESALKILGYRVKSVFGRELPIEILRQDYVRMGLQSPRITTRFRICHGRLCTASSTLPFPARSSS